MDRNEIWQVFRNFLFSKGNREFLIFLFFLALSGIFWLSLTLNDTYEKELIVPVTIASIPKDIVLTSDETDTLKITVRDKGIILLSYLYGDQLRNINVSFKGGDKGNGTGQVSNAELQRHVAQQLAASSKIVGIKPDHINFFYNTGASKRVPIRWSGRVIPEHLYFISQVEYSPDSITIYASEEKLDSIRTVYTEPLNYANFRDTLKVDCKLKKTEGVKMVPDQVRVTFHTDVLTEESIDGVPIQGIHMPEGKKLRTFPAKVKVSFVTGVSLYRNLKPSDFTVVADYNELKGQNSEKCNIYLQVVPHGISRAKLSVQQVDYLIEEEE
jgi:hypothetical protein